MRRAAAPVRTLAELSGRMDPRPEGKCLVGLSGGADSVALTYLLLPLRESGAIRLEAVHVNHGLRGSESDGDERFVREMCEELKIPLRVFRPDLRGRRDENAAREARYAAFAQAAREAGASALVLAHQREDQAETLLLHLLRGAGPEGLGGMKRAERRDGYLLLRPLLGISGRELREALRAEGLRWREDGSNQETKYFRNRIRSELLPLMERMAPGAAGRIARTADMIGLENEAMAEEAEAMASRPPAVRRRALRLWWQKEGPRLEERGLSYEQTLRLDSLTEAPRGTIINLPGGWRARREKRHLRLLDPENRTKNNRPARGQEEQK